MRFLTDRKRAEGLGPARAGTEHHWHMQVSAVGLAIMVPLFIFTFGSIIGGSHDEVTAYFARPFPAIVAALTIVVGFVHFKNGAQMMIEDYTKGLWRKALIISAACLSYAAIATGLFALVKLAL
ncbi:MAG: succinate dehydrogenase, hydrophobic membrane anchor protein [Rhodobacteraceae bacterium]|nr:succinate dehydrogenase, hydrophobic membrane anchor protein [Paracoccaceae bacterium]